MRYGPERLAYFQSATLLRRTPCRAALPRVRSRNARGRWRKACCLSLPIAATRSADRWRTPYGRSPGVAPGRRKSRGRQARPHGAATPAAPAAHVIRTRRRSTAQHSGRAPAPIRIGSLARRPRAPRRPAPGRPCNRWDVTTGPTLSGADCSHSLGDTRPALLTVTSAMPIDPVRPRHEQPRQVPGHRHSRRIRRWRTEDRREVDR